MMIKEKLEGLIAAPFTPMDEHGELNLEIVPFYYQMLKKNNIHGAFICGSTGEGVSLSLEEKKQVAKAWMDAKGSDQSFKVMLLLGGTCIQDCITLAQFAKSIHIDAVSFTSPFYFKPSNAAMLAECCKQVADSVPDIPFYYYHIPVLNGCNLSMLSLLEQVDGLIPNFAGIKYTHEDFMDFLSCLHFAEGKFDMLWGRDENMLSALVLGTKGAVGSTFNYAAPLYNNLIKAYTDGDVITAQKLQQQSIDMITLLGKYGGIATGKTYMKYIGLDCGKFRLPVFNMEDDAYLNFRSEVAALGFGTYCSLL